MNESFLFYWCSWLIWGIVTFFFTKSKIRTVLAIYILILIISTYATFSIISIQIQGYLLVLVAGAFVFTIFNKRKLYNLFSALTVAFGYTALVIWIEVYSISLFVSKTLLLTGLLLVLIRLFSNDVQVQLIIALLGITIGEIVYECILLNYHFISGLGESDFLNFLSLIVLFILMISALNKLYFKVKTYLIGYKKSLE